MMKEKEGLGTFGSTWIVMRLILLVCATRYEKDIAEILYPYIYENPKSRFWLNIRSKMTELVIAFMVTLYVQCGLEPFLVSWIPCNCYTHLLNETSSNNRSSDTASNELEVCWSTLSTEDSRLHGNQGRDPSTPIINALPWQSGTICSTWHLMLLQM